VDSVEDLVRQPHGSDEVTLDSLICRIHTSPFPGATPAHSAAAAKF